MYFFLFSFTFTKDKNINRSSSIILLSVATQANVLCFWRRIRVQDIRFNRIKYLRVGISGTLWFCRIFNLRLTSEYVQYSWNVELQTDAWRKTILYYRVVRWGSGGKVSRENHKGYVLRMVWRVLQSDILLLLLWYSLNIIISALTRRRGRQHVTNY